MVSTRQSIHTSFHETMEVKTREARLFMHEISDIN